MFYGHQGCRGPQGLKGWVTAKGTWQHYVGPGEASHLRGGQKSDQLPFHLLGHYVDLPNGAQEHPGNFLPHSIRADISITSFFSIAKGQPSGGMASFSCSSHIGAQTVPSAQKMMPFPRPHGEHAFGWNHFKGNPGGPPSSKWQDTLPWKRVLQPSCTKAFSWNLDLVQEAREAFFSKHSYNFVDDGTHNLSEIFQQMATNADLLGTSIHKIQASWTGLEELKQANYALRALPKGLKFLCMVPPSECPKVMGLIGIHNPDALCHFSGITHCTWCEKEGQNEGTMVNHLQTVHYRLGLVCDRCYDCPFITSDTFCWHGSQDCCQPQGKILMSQSCPHNHQERQSFLSWEPKQGGQDEMVYPRLPYQEYPYPLLQPRRRTSG